MKKKLKKMCSCCIWAIFLRNEVFVSILCIRRKCSRTREANDNWITLGQHFVSFARFDYVIYRLANVQKWKQYLVITYHRWICLGKGKHRLRTALTKRQTTRPCRPYSHPGRKLWMALEAAALAVALGKIAHNPHRHMVTSYSAIDAKANAI